MINRIITSILIVFTISACTYKIDLMWAINTDCSVSIDILDGKTQIRNIAVVEINDGEVNYGKILWEINGDYEELSKFTYGVLPNGFEQITQAKPLLKGKSYYFVVEGSGGGFGAIKVEYNCQ